METNNELIFLWRKVSAFKIGSKIINPSKPAAFAAAVEASGLREGPPGAFAMNIDVTDETFVFLLGPCTLVGVVFLTAGGSHHGE